MPSGDIVVLRCDASPDLGFGHLTRCRALAQAIRQQGGVCAMIGPDAAYATEADTEIFTFWEPLKWNDSRSDAIKLTNIAQNIGAKILVLDDYRVDETYQLILHGKSMKWLQFEIRTDQPIWADFILNVNPAAKPADYAAVIRNQDTRLLLGPEFAILRPEFAYASKRPYNRSVREVLLTFGGGDDRGAILLVLRALHECNLEDIKITVVSGAHNPRNLEIRKWIDVYLPKLVTLLIAPPNIQEIFSQSDLAFMAAGTSIYEMACCGVPMILISIAENQVKQAKAWSKATVYLGSIAQINKEIIIKAFEAMRTQDEKREAITRESARMCDGIGANRIASIIL